MIVAGKCDGSYLQTVAQRESRSVRLWFRPDGFFRPGPQGDEVGITIDVDELAGVVLEAVAQVLGLAVGLAFAAVSPCEECDRWNYHLATCSRRPT